MWFISTVSSFFVHLKAELWVNSFTASLLCQILKYFYLPAVNSCGLLLSTCAFTEVGSVFGLSLLSIWHHCCFCLCCVSRPLQWSLVLVTFRTDHQTSDGKPFRGEGQILAHSLRVQSLMGEEMLMQTTALTSVGTGDFSETNTSDQSSWTQIRVVLHTLFQGGRGDTVLQLQDPRQS